MKSQTERPPNRPGNARSSKAARSNKSNRYHRQTARGIDAKRDGKPLIFGWGKQLSHSEKTRLQRRSVWAFTGLIILVIVAVLAGSWINNNIIIPGLPITTVNGHQIPQSQFRKMVALQTLIENNKLNGKHGLKAQLSSLETQNAAQLATVNSINSKITSLNAQIAKLPKGPSAQRTQLNNQLKTEKADLTTAQAKENSISSQINSLTASTNGAIPVEEEEFVESPIGNNSVSWLQEDELVREWLANQSVALQNRINPTDSAVQNAINALAAEVPTSTSYSSLLSQMGVSDGDMHDMMTIKLRLDNMQTYLASQIKSPAYQVHARSMTIDTLAHAQAILKQLQANDATNFAQLAKKNSQDSATASSGGDLGWLARGQYTQSQQAAAVDNWLFDPHRYVGELSPIISENGTYRILQILSIDPSRAVDSQTLQTLQGTLSNPTALNDWVSDLEAQPSTHVSQADQSMMATDSSNFPPTSILPDSAPATTNPSTGTGGP